MKIMPSGPYAVPVSLARGKVPAFGASRRATSFERHPVPAGNYAVEVVPGTDPAFVRQVRQAMEEIVAEDPLYRVALAKQPLIIRVCPGTRQFFKGIPDLQALFEPTFLQTVFLPRLRQKIGTGYTLPEESNLMMKVLRSLVSGTYAFYLDGSRYLMIHDLSRTDRKGQVKAVLRHELSHMADYAGGDPNLLLMQTPGEMLEVPHLSFDPEFAAAAQMDLAGLLPWQKPTPSGRTVVQWPDWVPLGDRRLLRLNFFEAGPRDMAGQVREVFAEALATVRGGGAYSSPPVIRRMFSRATQWLDTRLTN
jgi:hypothetical protein